MRRLLARAKLGDIPRAWGNELQCDTACSRWINDHIVINESLISTHAHTHISVYASIWHAIDDPHRWNRSVEGTADTRMVIYGESWIWSFNPTDQTYGSRVWFFAYTHFLRGFQCRKDRKAMQVIEHNRVADFGVDWQVAYIVDFHVKLATKPSK